MFISSQNIRKLGCFSDFSLFILFSFLPPSSSSHLPSLFTLLGELLVMEFWKCLNEGKGLFLPEELELPEDVVNNTSNCLLVPSQDSIGGQELIQFGFPDARGRIRRDPLTDRIGLDCCMEVASPTCESQDVASQDKQLGSRMTGFFVGSDGLELGTVDLKLGGLADSKGASDGVSSVISSMPVPTKRSRLASSYTHTPVCQVHGCNKDLSSFKDYYKRHKVCDAHTKTAKVIVKGIEQRFCQQCSRFHLVAEFDDGKRSCRKRLANHNERRRKSPGTRFLRSSSMRTSFLFQEMCATATSGPSKQEPGKWFGHMKFEDPILDSNALLNFHDSISAGTVDTSAGIAVPSDRDFSHIPDSSRALSLLSAQSLSNHSYISAQGLTYPLANSEKCGPSGFNSAAKAEPTATVPDDSILIGSNTSNSKYCLPSGQGTMVDLLQLSTHLQMVERKRNSCTEEVQHQ